MKLWIFYLVLFFTVFLESTYIALPLTFDILLLFYLLNLDNKVFPAVFLSGFLLDTITARTIGITSIFILLFLLFVIFYSRKFEIQTYPFLFFASLIGGALFLHFFDFGAVFLPAFINSLLVLILFRITKKTSIS